jgi:hypothetical protein
MTIATTADNIGNFEVSFQPNVVGDWGWVAFYPGEQKSYINYPAANCEFNTIKVTAPPTDGTTSPGGNGGGTVTQGIPMDYVYAAVAVIVIVAVAIGAYAYTKSKKESNISLSLFRG